MGYKRARERKRQLKKLYDKTKYSYSSGGCYYDYKKNRYVQYSYSSNSKTPKCYKTRANRKVRKVREEDLGSAPSLYKKFYDYWWNLL